MIRPLELCGIYNGLKIILGHENDQCGDIELDSEIVNQDAKTYTDPTQDTNLDTLLTAPDKVCHMPVADTSFLES